MEMTTTMEITMETEITMVIVIETAGEGIGNLSGSGLAVFPGWV